MSRASVRALSGDVSASAAAAAGESWRTEAPTGIVARVTVAASGQMSRSAVTAGAVMDTVVAPPA